MRLIIYQFCVTLKKLSENAPKNFMKKYIRPCKLCMDHLTLLRHINFYTNSCLYRFHGKINFKIMEKLYADRDNIEYKM